MTINVDEIEWRITPEEEDIPIRGSFASGDDKADEALAREIEEELDGGNPWAWCYVKVTGRYRGLVASTTLGACSYKSEKDFSHPDGYLPQMKRDVIDELQTQVDIITGERP